MKNESRPYSQACENNKFPILEVLKNNIPQGAQVLEVGHGTGQHADFFSANLDVDWYASDRRENHWMLAPEFYLNSSRTYHGPFQFEVTSNSISHDLPRSKFDVLFSANTLHIIAKMEAQYFLSKLSEFLRPKALVIFYGPFNRDGQYTSSSNQAFDHSLKERNPQMGIRDLEWVAQILEKCQMRLLERIDMPANNMILKFQYAK